MHCAVAACCGLLFAASAAAQEAEGAASSGVLDHARIEELRVRGETVSVVVRPKRGNARAYQIVPADGSRDLSAGPHSSRGAAGQRVWNVLDF